jgi:hypothetical protein
MPFLANLIRMLQSAVYHSAEGIGALVEHGPRQLGSLLKGAGQFGSRKIGNAFSATQSGIYHAAEGIGRAVEDPIGTARTLASGARRLGNKVWNSNARQSLSRYFSNYIPHMQNAWQGARNLAGAAWRGIPGGVRRTAAAAGALGIGALSLGMKSLGAGVSWASAMFKSLAAPVGGLAKSVGLFRQFIGPTALSGAIYGLKKFVEGVVDSNRSLAKWNGRLAASFAMLDVKKMRLDIQTANASSGTGAELNSAFGQLLHELQPLREDLAVFMNLVALNIVKTSQSLVALVKSAIELYPALKEIVDGINALEDEAKKKNNNDAHPGNDAMNALANMQPGNPRPAAAPPRPFLEDKPIDLKEAIRRRNLAIRGQM